MIVRSLYEILYRYEYCTSIYTRFHELFVLSYFKNKRNKLILKRLKFKRVQASSLVRVHLYNTIVFLETIL